MEKFARTTITVVLEHPQGYRPEVFAKAVEERLRRGQAILGQTVVISVAPKAIEPSRFDQAERPDLEAVGANRDPSLY